MLWVLIRIASEYLDRVKRIWYLSPMRAAKVQASLRIRAVSPEPSLLAHTSSESRGTFRQKTRSLASLNDWACTGEICHDGMLEDTNSLDRAHLFLWRIVKKYSLIIIKYPPYLFLWNTHLICSCSFLSLKVQATYEKVMFCLQVFPLKTCFGLYMYMEDSFILHKIEMKKYIKILLLTWSARGSRYWFFFFLY